MKKEQVEIKNEVLLICKAINQLNGDISLESKDDFICMTKEDKIHYLQVTKDMIVPFENEDVFPHEYISLIYLLIRMTEKDKKESRKDKIETLFLLPRFVRNYLAQQEKTLDELEDNEMNFLIQLLMSYYNIKNKKSETTINFIKQLEEIDKMEDEKKQKRYCIN